MGWPLFPHNRIFSIQFSLRPLERPPFLPPHWRLALLQIGRLQNGGEQRGRAWKRLLAGGAGGAGELEAREPAS